MFDKNNNPLAGYEINIDAPAALNVDPLAGHTDEHGKISFRLYTTAPGAYQLTILAEAGTYQIPVDNITFVEHTADFPPVVLATNPKDTDDEYEVTNPIEIRFNKAIDFAQSTNLSITFSALGKEDKVVRPGDANGNWQYIEDERKIVWTPAKPLWANLVITATLQGAEDSAGYEMNPYTWSFIAIDESGPSLIAEACYPRDREVEVPLNAKVKLVFDEAIYSENNKPFGLQLKLTNQTNSESVVFGSDDFAFINGTDENNQVELDLTGYLTSDSVYEIEITGALDNAQNKMQPEIIRWTFATLDLTPPEVVSVYPSPQVIPEGEFTRKITISFSENVDLTNALCQLEVWNDELEVWEATNINLGSNYDEISYTWTLFPVSSEWLYNLKYRVTVTGVQDKIYNPYGEPKTPNQMAEYSWQFTPLLSASAPNHQEYPAKGALDVSIQEKITITFDKPILFANADIILKTKEDSIAVPGEITYLNPIGTSATGIIFTPTEPLLYDTWYLVDVKGIEGVLPGSRLADYSYSFRTVTLGSTMPVLSSQDNNLEFPIGPVVGDSRLKVGVFIPKDGVTADTPITVNNVPADQKSELSQYLYADGQGLSSAVYEISLDGKLIKKATLTIPFVDDGTGNVIMLDGSKVPIDSLQVFVWNPQRQEWHVKGGIVDLEARTISCEIEEFGIYALVGTSKEATALLSEVALTVNPLAFTTTHRAQTAFMFRLAAPAKVSLTLYDDRGRVVAQLLKDVPYPQGYHNFSWDGFIDGIRIQPGVYIYRLFVTSLDGENKGDAWVGGTLGVVR